MGSELRSHESTNRVEEALFRCRERAAEFGGTCEIERSSSVGTRGFARLPLVGPDVQWGRVMDKLRVLISDDHPLFRDGMRGLLSTQPDMAVVGEATTGEEAVRLAGDLEPDVVLMDIKMPGLGGIEVTRRILVVHPQVSILIVTMFEDDVRPPFLYGTGRPQPRMDEVRKIFGYVVELGGGPFVVGV